MTVHRAASIALAASLVFSACTGDGDRTVDPADISFPDPTVAPSTTTRVEVAILAPTTQPPAVIPVGGVVRVGVWGEPDPRADTLTGQMVRSLIQPQLFTAQPDGSWAASLVEPGTDADAADLRSAKFRLRPGAVWSDGTSITGGDLWSSADRRFVDEIDVADDGVFTVRFNQPFPNWRRLWSGDAVVMPEITGKFGGPWKVVSVNPDIETVLVPNEAWWGEGPYLDELRLVVVPDQGVMFDLFEDGELDVIAPNAVTGRLQSLEALAPGRVDTAAPGGWWVGLTMNPDLVAGADRAALLGAIDPEFFVGALLKGEAVTVGSLGGTAASYSPADLGAVSAVVTITAPDDVAMLSVVERAVLLAVRDAGGVVPELREGTSDLAEVWIRSGEAEAHIALHYDGPGGPCWTCRFATVDETAMRLADGGGSAPDALLAEQAIVKVLWRPVPAVAWAEGVNGIVVNGWALSAAWNAHEWWAG